MTSSIDTINKNAAATFFSLQLLGWFGYQAPPPGATQFSQNPVALQVIRLLTGPLLLVFIALAAILTMRYPLTRDRQERIRRSLLRRREK
jgi:Na+/melibiose symporter-like transporter